MLKLLINVTELLKRLGFLAVFMLPCVGVVLVAVAVYICLLGVGYIFKTVFNTVLCVREKKKIMRAVADSIREDKK